MYSELPQLLVLRPEMAFFVRVLRNKGNMVLTLLEVRKNSALKTRLVCPCIFHLFVLFGEDRVR